MTVDELEKEFLDLSHEDRAALLSRIKNHTKGKQPAVRPIKVDDMSEQGRTKPTITLFEQADLTKGNQVEFTQGQVIDLYDELRHHPICISSPEIQVLVKRWINIIERHHLLPDDVYQTARDHLANIGLQLVKGAESRAIPKRHVLFLKIARLERLYLALAVAMLGEPSLKKRRDWKSKRNLIGSRLKSHVKSQFASVRVSLPQTYLRMISIQPDEHYRCIELVLDFIMSGHRPARVSQRAWLYAYLAWRNDILASSVKSYLKSQSPSDKELNFYVLELLKEFNQFQEIVRDLREDNYPEIIWIPLE